MMKRTKGMRWVGVVCAFSLAGCAGRLMRVDGPIRYPVSKMVDVVDEYHGVKVPDPYRWLEDLDAPDTRAWIEEQNRLTFGYLEAIPGREAIRKRLTQLWDYERFSAPVKRGGRYFFFRNDGLQNQAVLLVAAAVDAEPRVLLDPNKLSTDGTVALSGWDVTDDGRRLAYGLSTAGSDWVEYRVRDVDTGEDLPDHLKWVKFSQPSWTKDGRGFYYSRYDEPADPAKLQTANYFQKLYYHRLGTPQAEDRLVYHRPDQKEWGFHGRVSDDGRYLIITVTQGTERRNRLYYADLTAGRDEIVRLLDDFDAGYRFIDNDGPVFWLLTDAGAPRGRVIAIDVRNPGREHWREVIPQADDTLEDVGVVGDRFVATYLQDAHSRIRVFDFGGRPVRDVDLPGLGSAGGFAGRRGDPETFYAFTSFSTPSTIYRYDVRTGESTIFREPRVEFDPRDYETRQVFYASKDGTRVPMFIAHRKGLRPDGNAPTYLYGYGGFNISLTPSFSVSRLVWMEMGGIFAMANLRGGGEYGNAWHDGGRLKNKQNTFDDFIAAAEWLIANGYTRPKRIAIVGGSNGGLLVGACMTQRPELFGAAMPAVGVMDMLRYDRYTIGWAWASDYGRPSDPEMFRVLRAYSPLHNLRPGTHYPATLITTADHDDRVVPSHSFKFAAALQAAQGGPGPVLIRIETRAGHGAGKPTTKQIDEVTDQLAFLTRVFGMAVRLPGSGYRVSASGLPTRKSEL